MNQSNEFNRSNYTLAHHIDQMTRLQQAGQTQWLQHYLHTQTPEIQTRLQPWYDHLTQTLSAPTPDLAIPLADCYRIEGWQVFYKHAYQQAQQYFFKAIQEPDWQRYATDASLCLAKVYTRTGHWQLARDWCLYYLQLARQSLYHFDIAKGYGALAEVFLRANEPKEALACFQLAFHLMPLQHGQQARQYNFMASALMRNQEWLRASVLLHTSQQISRNALHLDPRNSEALVGQVHSQMRLAFLRLLQPSSALDTEDNDYIEFVDEILPSPDLPITGLLIMPTGMLWIAKGIYYVQHQDNQAASQCFAQAMQIFEGTLIVEHYWATRLYHSCLLDKNGAEALRFPIPLVLNNSDLHTPILTQPITVDITWQAVKLPQQRFEPLFNPSLTQAALIDLWKIFFI